MGVSGRPILACACDMSDPGWSSEMLSLSNRPPAATAAASVNRTSDFIECFILLSLHDACWNFVDIGQNAEVDLLGSRGRLERKGVRDGVFGFPILDGERVLRRAGYGLLVMTYLRGIGRSPISTHSCQSVSWLRNARCSHSTPSITP
jgi:hypothetical protein